MKPELRTLHPARSVAINPSAVVTSPYSRHAQLNPERENADFYNSSISVRVAG